MDARTRIRNYFNHVITQPVRDDDDIFELGIVNSLFAMQLVMFVESEFSIVAERKDLEISNFCSIAALVAFVETKLGLPERGCGHPAD